MRLTGDDASRVLSKLCGIDLADEVTPNLRAFRSSVAKGVTDVVRDDFDGTWLEPVSPRHLGGRGLEFETVTTQIGARDRAHPDLIGGARG